MTPAEAKALWRTCAKHASEKLKPRLARFSFRGKVLTISDSQLDSIANTVARYTQLCLNAPSTPLGKETVASCGVVAIHDTTPVDSLFLFGPFPPAKIERGVNLQGNVADEFFGEFCALVFLLCSGADIPSVIQDEFLWEAIVRSMIPKSKRRHELLSVMLADKFPSPP